MARHNEVQWQERQKEGFGMYAADTGATSMGPWTYTFGTFGVACLIGDATTDVWFAGAAGFGRMILDAGAAASVGGVDLLEEVQHKYENIWPGALTVTQGERVSFIFANGQTQDSTTIAHIPVPVLKVYVHLRVLSANGPILAGMDLH